MPRDSLPANVAADIAKQVETDIRIHEGAFTQLVLNDFREGLQRNFGNDRIAYVRRWYAMYRRASVRTISDGHDTL